MEQVTLLVTNAGDCASSNFIRSLRHAEPHGYRVIGVETNELMVPHSCADENWLLPDPVLEEARYLEQLQWIVQEQGVQLVYGGDTGPDLTLISRHREALGAPVFLPEHADFVLFEDKWDTYSALVGIQNVKLPWSVLINTPADLDVAFARHSTLWLRHRSGSGGRGAISTGDPNFARQWVERHKGWGQFMAAECLTGGSATWSGLWNNGDLVACQARRRLFWAYGHTSPTGITGITGAQQTLTDPRLHAISVTAIRSTSKRPHGIISVDFTHDADGEPRITEVQSARFYTSIFFLAVAGLNLPQLYVDCALGRPLLAPEHARINPLSDQHVWLKQVEREPILTTVEGLKSFYRTVNTAGVRKASGLAQGVAS